MSRAEWYVFKCLNVFDGISGDPKYIRGWTFRSPIRKPRQWQLRLWVRGNYSPLQKINLINGWRILRWTPLSQSESVPLDAEIILSASLDKFQKHLVTMGCMFGCSESMVYRLVLETEEQLIKECFALCPWKEVVLQLKLQFGREILIQRSRFFIPCRTGGSGAIELDFVVREISKSQLWLWCVFSFFWFDHFLNNTNI